MDTYTATTSLFFFRKPGPTYNLLNRLFSEYPEAIMPSIQLQGYILHQVINGCADAYDISVSRREKADGAVHFGVNMTGEARVDRPSAEDILTRLFPIPPLFEPFGYIENGQVAVILSAQTDGTQLLWVPHIRHGYSMPQDFTDPKTLARAFWEHVKNGTIIALTEEIKQGGYYSLMYVRDLNTATYLLWDAPQHEGPLGDVAAFTNYTSLELPGAVLGITKLRELMSRSSDVINLSATLLS